MKTIQADMLRKMFIQGTYALSLRKEEINDLNVFPVPDGDTGTNMTMTAEAAAAEVERILVPEIKSICKAISGGSLRGARGNSGVILSQLFRGFTNGIKDLEEIDAEHCAHAMQRAVETAYKAVMKPKEGTILTVARAMADCAEENFAEVEDLPAFFAMILEAGEVSLAQTPELLPVLKEAGVVDSGGKGLLSFLQGAVDAFNGLTLDSASLAKAKESGSVGREFSEVEEQEITFGYCTEFIILLDAPLPEGEEEKIKEYLTSIGDSLVCVADEDLVKIHVHTNDPGLAIQKGLTYGQLTRLKIDNMREEHRERLFKPQEVAEAKKQESAAKTAAAEVPAASPAPDAKLEKAALLAVCAGDGLAEIFREMGVSYVLTGGQTMNPSAEEFLEAVQKMHAETVYILPNNKNILLAAEQAAQLCKSCKIEVIPTKTIPEGIAACVEFMPEADASENLAAMTGATKHVQSAELTRAVRSTSIDGIAVRKNDFIVLGTNGLLASGRSLPKTVLSALADMAGEEIDVISIYTGEDMTDEDAEKLSKAVQKAYPEAELVLLPGGQPVYHCIFSVE